MFSVDVRTLCSYTFAHLQMYTQPICICTFIYDRTMTQLELFKRCIGTYNRLNRAAQAFANFDMKLCPSTVLDFQKLAFVALKS